VRVSRGTLWLTLRAGHSFLNSAFWVGVTQWAGHSLLNRAFCVGVTCVCWIKISLPLVGSPTLCALIVFVESKYDWSHDHESPTLFIVTLLFWSWGLHCHFIVTLLLWSQGLHTQPENLLVEELDPGSLTICLLKGKALNTQTLEWYKVIRGKKWLCQCSCWYPYKLTTRAEEGPDRNASDRRWEKEGRVWRLVGDSRRYVVNASRYAKCTHDCGLGGCNGDTSM